MGNDDGTKSGGIFDDPPPFKLSKWTPETDPMRCQTTAPGTTAACVFGLAGFFGIPTLLTAPLGLYCAMRAKRHIDRNPGQYGGARSATFWGVVCFLQLLVWVVLILYFVLRVLQAD